MKSEENVKTIYTLKDAIVNPDISISQIRSGDIFIAAIIVVFIGSAVFNFFKGVFAPKRKYYKKNKSDKEQETRKESSSYRGLTDEDKQEMLDYMISNNYKIDTSLLESAKKGPLSMIPINTDTNRSPLSQDTIKSEVIRHCRGNIKNLVACTPNLKDIKFKCKVKYENDVHSVTTSIITEFPMKSGPSEESVITKLIKSLSDRLEYDYSQHGTDFNKYTQGSRLYCNPNLTLYIYDCDNFTIEENKTENVFIVTCDIQFSSVYKLKKEYSYSRWNNKPWDAKSRVKNPLTIDSFDRV